MSDQPRCRATTKAGAACRARPQHDKPYCLAHDQKARESTGFGGAQPGAGRPPAPRAVDLIRERIEQDLDRWLKPLEDALEAERAVVVGTGENAHIEFSADHATRLRAVGEALDRAYGRPKQTQEMEITRPESLVVPELPSDEEWREGVRRALLELDSPAPVMGEVRSNGHGP